MHLLYSDWISLRCFQELHIHGNSTGDEGVRSLMSGLSSHKGLHFVISNLSLSAFVVIGFYPYHPIAAVHLTNIFFLGKTTLLDLGNNSITAKGAFHVAEYIKRSKSLLWMNLYMNDIGDEVFNKLTESIYQVIFSRFFISKS